MALFHENIPAGGTGVVAQGGKKTEVLKAIEAKVGLSFEQFTRAVLLAQNDFATFLKADDKERALILQTLTGTGRFERLSVAIFERCKHEDEAVKNLEAELKGQVPLSPEDRAAAEKEKAEADKALTQIETSLTEKGRYAAWFERHRELNTQLAQATLTWEAAKRLHEEASPRLKKLQRVEQATKHGKPLWTSFQREDAQQKTCNQEVAQALQRESLARLCLEEQNKCLAGAQPLVDQAKETLRALSPAIEEARRLDTDLKTAGASLLTASSERSAAESQNKEMGERSELLRKASQTQESKTQKLLRTREKFLVYAPVMEQAPAWIERLNSTQQARTGSEAQTRDLEQRVLKMEELRNQTKKAAEALETEKASIAQVNARVKETEGKTKCFDEKVITEGRRRLEAEGARLSGVRNILQSFTGTTGRIATLSKELSDWDAQCAKNKYDLDTLSTQSEPAALSDLENARHSLKVVEATLGDQAALLRKLLRPGEACPVCGSREHAHTEIPPDINEALMPLKARETKCDGALTGVRAQIARLKTEIAHAEKQCTKIKSELKSAQSDCEKQKAILQQDPSGIALLARPEAERSTLLEQELQAQISAMGVVYNQEESFRTASQQYQAARDAADKAREAFSRTEKRHTELSQTLAINEEAYKTASEQLARSQADYQNQLRTLEELFQKLPYSYDAFQRDALSFIGQFQKGTQSLRALETQMGEAKAEAEKLALQHAALRDELAKSSENLAKRQEAESALKKQHEMLLEQRLRFLGGRKADEVEGELRKAVEISSTKLEEAKQAQSKAERDYAAASESLKTHSAALADVQTRSATARNALEVWLSTTLDENDAPLGIEGLGKLLALDETWLQNEQAAIDGFRNAALNAGGVLQARKQSQEQHLQGQPAGPGETELLSQLEILREEKSAASKRQVAAATVLGTDHRCHEQQAEVLQSLDVQRAIATPWAGLNELLGSSDGSKFRGIAQRRTLDVLLGYANAQLELITSRYRLERLANSLSLIVVDRDMADERRSVHTLSGGETFLVSLALALGLASLSSNRVRIESLFIDEGFGSLDQATLSTAMNAMMHLEAQGRKVGVISHVSEMADAIPVQIKVVKGRSGASRIEVPNAAQLPQPDLETSTKPASKTTDHPELLPMVQIPLEQMETLRRNALDYLSNNGGKAGNHALRTALELDEAHYLALKEDLLASQRVKAGKGKGGSLYLNQELFPESSQ
jgi:exonuclease SbcC